MSCPICARPAAPPFVEIAGVPVHVSQLHRAPSGARAALRGDLELVCCAGCGFVWNAAYDAALVEYDAAYENSLDHSPAFVEYVDALAARLVERYALRGRSVVEIGCGQADFLRRLCAAGGNAGIGYDPSYVGPDTEGPVTVHREHYSEATVGDLEPDLIACRHVLEHIEDPLELIRSLRRTLDPERGTPVYFEVPNGEFQLANGVIWDMIYAHVATFTEPSLRALFERGGFEVVEVGTSFGGQYLWIEARPAADVAVTEDPDGVARVAAAAQRFGAAYAALVRDWNGAVEEHVAAGRRVVLWGGGAKGVSLINALDRPEGVGRVVDVNPRKDGSFVPGAGTPVVGPEALAGFPPDVVVLANPIYREEIRARLAELGHRPVVTSVRPARVVCLIPTYNRARWLGGAIESILAQTHRDFRLIVADNASTDGTAEIVAGFDDPRIEYVRRAENCGLNEHYNGWFASVEGEFLFIVPDDDRLLPDALERALAALEANPRAAFVHGQVDVIDEHDAVIAAGHDMTGLTQDTVESGADFIRRSMEMSYRVHASTVLLRTAAVRRCLLDERDYPVTDLGHWMRVALGWDIAFLARPLARYRVHTGAYSAGAAAVTDGGYIQGVDRIQTFLDVKLRFVEENRHRLSGVRGLRDRAHRAFRRELLEQAAHATFPQRRIGATLGALRACARLDGAIVREPAAWRLLAGAAIGPRAASVVRRARRRQPAQQGA